MLLSTVLDFFNEAAKTCKEGDIFKEKTLTEYILNNKRQRGHTH